MFFNRLISIFILIQSIYSMLKYASTTFTVTELMEALRKKAPVTETLYDDKTSTLFISFYFLIFLRS